MKKLLLTALAALCLAGCFKAEPETVMYFAPGYYYTCGEVLTEDGNLWGYSQDFIDDKPSYNDEAVYVLFCNAGTPDNIYDDEIVGLVGR